MQDIQASKTITDPELVQHEPVQDAELQEAILFEGATSTGYQVLVRTPATLKGQEYAFPAPPPKDATRYDAENNAYTKANFDDEDQLYWINGITKLGTA